INVERSSLDVEEETTRKPINFDTLLMKSNIPQYTVDEELFDELRAKGMVGEYYLPDTLNRDFNKAYVLALKLFQASKSLNGIYDFEISLEEIDELLALYRNLVDTYELLHATREAEKSNIKKLASHELSEKFKKLVVDLKLDLSTITLEDVEEYRQNVKEQINDIRNELTVVRGELPNNDYMDSQYDILAGFDETCLSSDEIKKIVSLH
ncbi:MAG: hypothetical protein K2I70_02065, partial [Bacilli bacterium]|nr:hypothetical protein [Bacilli bacterium]